MKSNRGTKRGCVWNNNTCCHWAGDATPRTCCTFCANRLQKSKRTTLIRMKGLVAGLPAAQYTHSTLCSSISVCRGFVSGLLIFTPAGGAGGCLDYFQCEGKSAGQIWVSWAPRVHLRICLCPEECVSVEFRDQNLSSASSTKHRNQTDYASDGSLASACTCGATIPYLKQPKQEATAAKQMVAILRFCYIYMFMSYQVYEKLVELNLLNFTQNSE